MDNYSLLRTCLSANKNTLTGGATAMHSKHYSKQMEKRQRITGHTLVVGMDIGSEFNAACFMDKEGNNTRALPHDLQFAEGLRLFSYDTYQDQKEAQAHRCADRHGADRPLLEEDRLLRQGKRL